MSTYISIIFSEGSHGTHLTKYRLGVQVNGKTNWYGLKPNGIINAGKALYDLGIKIDDWLFNQSVQDNEKIFNLNVRALMEQGYKERKNTTVSPKDSCISKIFSHCDKPEFINSLAEEELKVYHLLKKHF